MAVSNMHSYCVTQEEQPVIPEELRYTRDHEWLAQLGADTVRVGITDYAQQQLGDVVFVELPEVGAAFAAGEPLGSVESTKSVSDVLCPVAGEVTAVNSALLDQPELVNADPYAEGWIVELRLAKTDSLADLLDAAQYEREVADKD